MMPFSPKPLMNSWTRRPALSDCLSYGHPIALGGITFLPDLTGALYAPAFKALLVADLHLEQGSSLARRGIPVPPYDTGVTLASLESLVASINPSRLILLGDSFHDAVAHAFLDDPYTERLRAITATRETIWITGNHDPAPPANLGGTSVDEHHLGDIVLRHIPARKLNDKYEIAGHLHPGATIVQRNVATRAKCFVGDGRRLILPAFGAYTGAVNVRSTIFSGLFDQDAASVWMLASSTIHRFPFTRCG
jgi:uncharacterized protein